MMWDPILKKFERKLSCWKVNRYSPSGRIMLIKSVLSGLPNYFMYLFHIPFIVKEKVDKIQRKFL
ncbi:hypothetical protein DITRI_Ditri19aG0113500 [Diplodiscus trichospermus]